MNTSTVRTDESRARAERNHAEARNGPPAGLGVGLILILLAAGLLAFERYALSPHAIDQVGWDWWRQAAERIGPWPRRIGLICLGGGVGLTVAWLVRSVRYRMRRQAVEMITQVAANLLKIDRQQLRLCRAKWRSGLLVSGRLHYLHPHLVVQDSSRELVSALASHLAGRSSVTWERKRRRFTIRPRPDRLEEKYPEVQRVAKALSHVVGELAIDQKRTQVNEDGSVQCFAARYRHTTKDIGDGFRLRIQTIVDAKAPSVTGYWSVAWTPAANQIELKPAQPLPTVAPYPTELPELHDQMVIPLGVGEGGKLVNWLPETLPHMLLVGPTGTGKTVFLFSLLVSCLARGWAVILVDPKELSFRGFDPVVLQRRGLEQWPGIDEIATSEIEMEHALGRSYDRMRDRYAALKHFEVKEEQLRPLLVVVDETGEMAERLNEYQGSTEKKELAEAAGRKAGGAKNPELRKLWSNLRLGRQGRVFVVTATQRPDVTFIPGEARSNLTTRVGLGRLEGQALEMVFNTRAVQQRMTEMVTDPATGERVAKRIRGRANVDVGGGPQTIQTFFVPDPAKLITNELGASDIAAIQNLQQLVRRSRERWGWQQEAPAAGELKSELEHDSAAVDLSKSAIGGQTEEAPLEIDQGSSMPATVRGRDLEVGMRVMIALEGDQVEVEIEDIDEDPMDPDLLEVTVMPDDGGVSIVTTVSPDETLTTAD